MAPRSEDPKLIIRVTNLELVQPICSAYINVTDRQTTRTAYYSNLKLEIKSHVFVVNVDKRCNNNATAVSDDALHVCCSGSVS